MRGEQQRSGAAARAAGSARCEVWGVVNVTPDSFSDGGLAATPEAAVAHGRRLLAEGADVIDVGGESSRPRGQAYGQGAVVVPVEEEIRRVAPVVEQLAGEQGARVSVDTVKAEVARRALEAGASIVNDVSCGRSEELLRVVAEAGADLVLMHNRGGGAVVAENTTYGDLLGEVLEEPRKPSTGRAAWV